MSDPVNHPDHYTAGGIETIDFMRAKSSHEEFIGHLRLTALKYLSRGPFKSNPLEDYKKAAQYIEWLIKEVEAKKTNVSSYSVDLGMVPVITMQEFENKASDLGLNTVDFTGVLQYQIKAIEESLKNSS